MRMTHFLHLDIYFLLPTLLPPYADRVTYMLKLLLLLQLCHYDNRRTFNTRGMRRRGVTVMAHNKTKHLTVNVITFFFPFPSFFFFSNQSTVDV